MEMYNYFLFLYIVAISMLFNSIIGYFFCLSMEIWNVQGPRWCY